MRWMRDTLVWLNASRATACSCKLNLRPSANDVRMANVTNPKPPSCTNTTKVVLPNIVRLLAVSTTDKPVTVTADVAIKRALNAPIDPDVGGDGNRLVCGRHCQ